MSNFDSTDKLSGFANICYRFLRVKRGKIFYRLAKLTQPMRVEVKIILFVFKRLTKVGDTYGVIKQTSRKQSSILHFTRMLKLM